MLNLPDINIGEIIANNKIILQILVIVLHKYIDLHLKFEFVRN